MRILPEYIERVVVASKPQIAGTFDRIVEINETRYVADLKTGANAVAYGVTSIAMQLAIYANADYLWKGDAEVADLNRDHNGRYLLPNPAEHPDAYEPMPEVDKTRAVIIHLPVDQARCDLYWVDIASGVDGVAMALWVREWRKRELHFPLNPEPFGMTLVESESEPEPIEEAFQLIQEEFTEAEVIPIGGAKATSDDW